MSEYDVSWESVDQVVGALQPVFLKQPFQVAITGAGISYGSGLPLATEMVGDVELSEIFRQELLENHPGRFYEIYREFLLRWRTARPNAAHRALHNLGAWIITQNIDGLHRDCGTHRLIEIHGNLRELRCASCVMIFSFEIVLRESVPRCPQCARVLEPGFTLEGQEVRHISRATEWVGRADLLWVVGTSLEMEPVRTLVAVAKKRGIDILWVNGDAEILIPKMAKGLGQEKNK